MYMIQHGMHTRSTCCVNFNSFLSLPASRRKLMLARAIIYVKFPGQQQGLFCKVRGWTETIKKYTYQFFNATYLVTYFVNCFKLSLQSTIKFSDTISVSIQFIIQYQCYEMCLSSFNVENYFSIAYCGGYLLIWHMLSEAQLDSFNRSPECSVIFSSTVRLLV